VSQSSREPQCGSEGGRSIAREACDAGSGKCGNLAVADGADALVAGVGDVDRVVRADCDALWSVKQCADSRCAITAESLDAGSGYGGERAGEGDFKDLVAVGVDEEQVSGRVVRNSRRQKERGGLGKERSVAEQHQHDDACQPTHPAP